MHNNERERTAYDFWADIKKRHAKPEPSPRWPWVLWAVASAVVVAWVWWAR